MGRVCALAVGVILPVAVALVPVSRVDAAEPASLKIGLPESMFSGLPPAVVAPVAKPFQDMFEKQTGLKGEIAVVKDYKEIADKLRAGTLDVAVFHGFEYAWVRHHTDLIPLLITVPGNKLQACLVVNANSDAKGANDLKGSCVVIPNATKAHCHLYLDRLRDKLPEGCCGTAKHDGKSVEESLDAVADNTCQAALVDATALRTYQTNKPGVGKQLKVLVQSDPFPSAVVVYRKEAFDVDTAAKIRKGLIKGIETAQGKILTSLWRLKGFSEVTPQYQKDLDECLKAYPAPKK